MANNSYILYSTNCPKCNVLYNKLKNAGITFDVCEDVEPLIEMGYMSAPILFDGEKYYTFEESIKMINTMR